MPKEDDSNLDKNINWRDLYDSMALKYENMEQVLGESRKASEKKLNVLERLIKKQILKNICLLYDDLNLMSEALNANCPVPVKEGIELFRRSFDKFLETEEVERIDSVPGVSFDPAIHEAMSTQPSQSLGEGLVLESLRVGFTYKGELLRAARVVVSSGSE